MLGGLGGGWVGCFVRVGSIRGCLVVVLGVGRGGRAVFGWFFGAWWVFRVRGKVVSPGVSPCQPVFGDTGDTRFYMHGCNGRVCARCVCYLLVKVVSLVSPISTLTRGNPGDTRVKSCVTLCHLVSPKCLPNVRIFELQTTKHTPAAVCRARCISTNQHPVYLQLGGKRPALDRLHPFLRTPDVVGLA